MPAPGITVPRPCHSSLPKDTTMQDAASTQIPIHGTCTPGYEHIRDVFAENFQERGEIGSAVCIYKNGLPVIDLWGGHKDAERTRPWEKDTIVCMMSVAKSISALGVYILVERGEIDLDTPVAKYWKEFGQAGKSTITVRTLLGGRAGVLFADSAPAGSMLDYDTMVEAIARQPAEPPAAGRGAYHSLTMGFLLGALIESVDKRPFKDFIQQELCGPLGADYKFGLSDTYIERLAPVIKNTGNATMQVVLDGQAPGTALARAYHVMPKMDEFFANSDLFLKNVFPSGNGVGNARGIARIYALLAEGGTLDGIRLFSPTLVEEMRQLQWTGPCMMTGRDYRYAMGFFLNQPYFSPMGKNPNAFGHMGAGGSIGFADPEAGISFSYSPNFMCAGEGVGDRAEALIDALYAETG